MIEIPVLPPPEDRLYLPFIGIALVFALGAGFVLAVLLPLTAAGHLDWAARYPAMVQAHGAVQLQGFAGLFVAGMGLRLVPRFAGARPAGPVLARTILAALTAGLTLRLAVLLWPNIAVADPAGATAAVASSAGMALFGASLAHTLVGATRKQREPWYGLVLLGAGWWVVWAALSLVAALRSLETDFVVPPEIDRAVTWAALLGAISNFTWAVQSRSVPVFFGRRPPTTRRVLVPALLLNAGAAGLVLAAGFEGTGATRIEATGFVLAAAGLLSLPLLTGAVAGRPHRLRPRSQFAARFVVSANRWALIAGLLLTLRGLHGLTDGAFGLATAGDAARHAIGVGFLTNLIVGMALLLAPIFALERTEARGPGRGLWFALLALQVAATLRVFGAVAGQYPDLPWRQEAIAAAGILAWLAVAAFALALIHARRSEPRLRRLIAMAARGGDQPG